MCAEYGQVKLFEDFHKRFPGDIDIKNRLDETPFCTAAREGRINILRMMYEKYPPPLFNADARTVDGWTAFSYATINGFLNTITFLAENKANIHTSDRIKRTALHWAARFNNTKVVQLLLNLGLSYQALDYESMTPQDLCQVHESRAAEQLIIAKIAEDKINKKNF